MGIRERYQIDLPPRWVVRKGLPCTGEDTMATIAGFLGMVHGMHLFMDVMPYQAEVGQHPRECLWCGCAENARGPGWTVVNPATDDLLHLPDYASAVRHASKGWHASLDTMQRQRWAVAKGDDALRRAGAYG